MKHRALFLSGLLAMLVLTSCENFLDGAGVKKQIVEQIEINNSNPVTIYISVEQGSGSVNLERISAKKKQKFDLVFTPSASWQFVGWEVYDHLTKQKIDDAIIFTDSTSPDTKVTVVKPLENIEIRARCLKVLVTPESGSINWANIPIKILFNVPVEQEVADSVKIEYGGVSLRELALFEEPVLSDDKTLITITPKPTALAAYITEQNLSLIKLDVILGSKIKTQGVEIPLNSSFQNFTIWYEMFIEQEKPVIHDFFVTHVPSEENTPALNLTLSTINAQDKFVSKTIDDLEKNDEDILHNRTLGTVYLYGRCYDKDSGIESITVYEKRTNQQDGYSIIGTLLEEKEIITEYTAESSDAEFLRDENGNFVFRIKYTLQGNADDPKNGAVRLKLEAKDMAGNSSEKKPELSLIKVSEIQLGDVKVHNYLYNCFYEEGTTNHPLAGLGLNWQKTYDFDYEYYEQNAKKIYLNDFAKDYPDGDEVNWSSINTYSDIHEFIYKNTVISADKLTVKMQLMDGDEQKSVNMQYDSEQQTWNIDLQQAFDVADLSGKGFKLIVTDDMGLTGEKEFTYPWKADCLCNDINNKYSIKMISNDYEESVNPKYQVLIVYKINGQYKAGLRKFLYSKYEYYTIPDSSTECFLFLMLDSFNSGFVSEKSKTYYPANVGSEDPAAIETWGTPSYSFSKSQISNCVDVIITINEHAWDNNRYDLIRADASFIKEGFFENGSNKIVIPVQIELLKKQENVIKLYGIKDSVPGPETLITITQQTQEAMLQYDNYISKQIFRNFNAYSNKNVYIKDYETLAITYSYDDDNDIEYFKFKLNDKNEVIFKPADYTDTDGYVNGTNNEIKYSNLGTKDAAIEIPEWYFRKDNNVITYEKKDFANNQVKETVKFSYPWKMQYEGLFPFDVLPQDNGKWRIETKPWTNGYSDRVDFYNLSGSDINAVFDYFTLLSYSYSSSQLEPGYAKAGKSDIVFPEDSFIRIVPRSCYGAQTIFYTGSAGSSNGKSDLLLQNGNSSDSVAIQSDAPVFVHTLITDEPYEVCKDWTITEWETQKKHIGNEILPPEGTSGIYSLRYDIPIEQIKTGQCYCVIAHYATNKILQSQVMVR